MFWKRKKRTHRYYRRTKRIKVNFWSKLSSKFLWFAIAFLTVLLLVYVFSFYRKLSQPEASEFYIAGKEPGKQISARVQILNGCSSESMGGEIAQKIAKRLKQLKSDRLEYEIVEVGKYDFGTFGLEDSLANESMILDRTNGEKDNTPSEIALITARALGIKTQNVICKKLEHNYRDITLSILIGNDYKTLLPGTLK